MTTKYFWDSLAQRSRKNVSPQISDGFHKLIEKEKLFSKIDWLDFGTYEKYRNMISKFSKYDFSKTDEFIYIINNIKLSNSSKIKKLQFKSNKIKINKNVFPDCKKIGSFYFMNLLKEVHFIKTIIRKFLLDY